MISSSPSWSVLALRTSHVEEALLSAYLQNLILQIKNKENYAQLFRTPLQQAIQRPFTFSEGQIKVSIDSLFLF